MRTLASFHDDYGFGSADGAGAESSDDDDVLMKDSSNGSGSEDSGSEDNEM